jgi:hypothetical protein
MALFDVASERLSRASSLASGFAACVPVVSCVVWCGVVGGEFWAAPVSSLNHAVTSARGGLRLAVGVGSKGFIILM